MSNQEPQTKIGVKELLTPAALLVTVGALAISGARSGQWRGQEASQPLSAPGVALVETPRQGPKVRFAPGTVRVERTAQEGDTVSGIAERVVANSRLEASASPSINITATDAQPFLREENPADGSLQVGEQVAGNVPLNYAIPSEPAPQSQVGHSTHNVR